MAKRALHVSEDCCANQTGECVGDQVSAEEDGVAEREFAARVPLRENEKCTGQKGGLNESNEESDSDHSGEVGGVARKCGDHAPEQHDEGDVEGWSGDAVDNHVGGNLPRRSKVSRYSHGISSERDMYILSNVSEILTTKVKILNGRRPSRLAARWKKTLTLCKITYHENVTDIDLKMVSLKHITKVFWQETHEYSDMSNTAYR